MQFTSIALLTLAAVVNARPNTFPTTTAPGGGSCPPTTTAPAPGTTPTATPSCPNGGLYNCQATLNILTCVNAANGNTITIPILQKRDLEERELEERTTPQPNPGNGAFCCNRNNLLGLLTCVNLLNGNTITIPIL